MRAPANIAWQLTLLMGASLALIVAAVFIGPLPVADELRVYVFYSVRLPRVFLCALLGGSLAVSGAVAQGYFRNVLADPSVIGVNLSAGLGAVIGFVLGLDEQHALMIPLLAASGAACHMIALMLFGRGRFDTGLLLLCGIALGALSSAGISLAYQLAISDLSLQRKVLTWLFGSFNGRTWVHVWVALGAAILGGGMAMRLVPALDTMLLGEEAALSLGIDMKKTQRRALGCISLMVGVATALVGVVGFVGLIIPHMVRHWVGPRHRYLFLFSFGLGAILLVTVDICIRSLPMTLQPGVLMSLLGAPFFLVLLLRRPRASSL